MKNIIVILISFLTVAAYSKGKPHRQHGAHHHGAGSLGIAFDGVQGKLELKVPAESILGFEHTAKTDKDKKTQESQLSKLETNIGDIVVFDSSLKCAISKDKMEMVKDEQEATSKKAEHSDVLAVFNVACEKSIENTKVVFNFQKYFPKIHEIEIQILVGSVQKSAEAKKSGTSVEIKM